MAGVALLMTGMLIWATTAMRGSNKNIVVAAVAFIMIVINELPGRIFFYDIMISAGADM